MWLSTYRFGTHRVGVMWTIPTRGIGVTYGDRTLPVCLMLRHPLFGKSPEHRRIGETQDIACGMCEKDLAWGKKEYTRDSYKDISLFRLKTGAHSLIHHTYTTESLVTFNLGYFRYTLQSGAMRDAVRIYACGTPYSGRWESSRGHNHRSRECVTIRCKIEIKVLT